MVQPVSFWICFSSVNYSLIITQVEIKKAEPRDSGKMGDGPPGQWGPPQGGPPMGMGGVSWKITEFILQ